MAAGSWKMWINGLVRKTGYQISRLEAGVAVHDAAAEQFRLLGDSVATILEVGAADGRDALTYAQHYPKARVLAFEPVPESFAKLKEKAASVANLTPFELALAAQPGTQEFHLAEWEDASSLLKPLTTGATFDAYHKSKRVLPVTVDTIDNVCAREGITSVDLLKIDSQGAELMVLSGAAELLAGQHIRVIYCEIQFLRLYENAARFDEIWSFLAARGYRLHNIYDVVHNHRGQICWGDAIFVREADYPSQIGD
jgi:FkbM family methyltransferase